MNKPKVGDKLYHVYCINEKVYIEEKEIIYHELDIYSYNDEYLLKDNTWVSSTKNADTFIQIEPINKTQKKFYYRTREQAIQKMIFEGSIEEHKQILKDLENE